MADSNYKRDDSGFMDNDPFAELMRIVSRETPAEPEAAPDPYAIDLEREMLGDFDLDDRAEVSAAASSPAAENDALPPAAASNENLAPASAANEPPATELAAADAPVGEETVDLDFDLELDDLDLDGQVEEPSGEPEPARTAEAAPAHELDAAFARDLDLAFAAEEAEPAAEMTPAAVEPEIGPTAVAAETEPPAPEIAQPDMKLETPAAAVPEAFTPEPAPAEPVAAEPISAVAPAEAAVTPEEPQEEATAPAAAPPPAEEEMTAPAVEPVADEAFPAATALDQVEGTSAREEEAAAPAVPSAGMAPSDVGSDDLVAYDDAVEKPIAAATPEPEDEPVAAAPAEPAQPDISAAPAAEADPFSEDKLLDDLDAIFAEADAGDTLSAPEAGAPAAEHVQQPEPEAPVQVAPAEDVAEETVPEPSLEDELDALLSGGGEIEPAAAAPAAPDVAQPSPIDMQPLHEAPIAEEEYASADAAPAADEAALHQAGAEDAMAWDDLVLLESELASIDEEPAAQESTVPAEAGAFSLPPAAGPTEETPRPEGRGAVAAAAAAFGGIAASVGWRPREEPRQDAAPAAPAGTGTVTAADDGAPVLETVEIEDGPTPPAGDLDIPDLPEPEPEPTAVADDIESELDVAFGSLAADLEETRGEAAPSSAAATAAEPPAGAQAGSNADNAAAFEGAAEDFAADYPEFGDIPFDYDEAEAQAAPPPVHAPQDGARRKYFILGGVAAVALIGGASYFLFSNPVGDGLPAIVRADADPVRVRPENPGGTSVPNQDSRAYERAAGEPVEADPGQESLISTTEELVALTPGTGANAPADDGLPLIGQDDGELLASIKTEQRIEDAPQNALADNKDQLLTIAPHRVRTVVVRPDGTIVGQEDAVAQPAGLDTNAATDAGAQTAALAAPQPALGEMQANAPAAGAVPRIEDAQPLGQPGMETTTTDETSGTFVMPETVSVVPTRPGERPEPSSAEPAQQPAATAVASTAPAPESASVPASEWSMQIASQPTAEGAQAAYQDLARRYSDVLEGKGVNIVRANIEGMGTFYRVRIPATDRDTAVALCTEYKAAGGNCFVSR